MVGLRLKDREETAMVLGDGARDAGADCHKIPATTPGVGYLIPDSGGPPIRVRGALIGDADIRALAAGFPARTHIPVVVPPEPEQTTRTRRSRKTDTGDGSGVAA